MIIIIGNSTWAGSLPCTSAKGQKRNEKLVSETESLVVHFSKLSPIPSSDSLTISSKSLHSGFFRYEYPWSESSDWLRSFSSFGGDERSAVCPRPHNQGERSPLCKPHWHGYVSCQRHSFACGHDAKQQLTGLWQGQELVTPTSYSVWATKPKRPRTLK